MEKGTITAKIGYLFFSTADKARLTSLKDAPGAELSKLYEGIALSDSLGKPEDLHPILADVKIGEDFLYGGGLTFPCGRYLWPDVELELPRFQLQDSHVLLTLYPESNICQAAVNLSVQVDSVEDLIYLRQIFLSDRKVTKTGRSISQVADLLFKPLGASVKEAETAYLLEINDFFGQESLETVIQESSTSLYGMMTGDEGHDFVPEELARARLENRWGSRDFFSAIAFRNNFLLLHLANSSRADAYRAHQDAFGRNFYGGPNAYFFMNARTAGVNHGMFFSVETGLVAKTICSNVLNHQSRLSHEKQQQLRKAIQTTKELRRDLITTLNRLESIGMVELGELERLIMSGLEITPMVEKIKYLLELLESELDLLYQTSTNKLVNILTVVGLLLSAVQVIMCFT